MMDTVSVIVPCFNQARFVAQAVRSALEQRDAEVEVIVVDDGSSDDPAASLAPMSNDPRLTLLRQPNAGVANARNHAIARSRGAFLHFLDADDWIGPDMLASSVAALKQDTRLGMVFCDITHVDEHGDVHDDYSVGATRPFAEGDLLPALLAGGFFPPVAVVATRAAIESTAGFDPPLSGCCDWDVWARMAALGYHARYIDRKLAFYRLHGSSMSRDAGHMRDTMERALVKITRAYPERVAMSLQTAMERGAALFSDAAKASTENARLSKALHDTQDDHVRETAEALRWHVEQVASLDRALQDASLALARADDAIRWHVEQNTALEQALAKATTDYADIVAAQERVMRDLLATEETLLATRRAIGDLTTSLRPDAAGVAFPDQRPIENFAATAQRVLALCRLVGDEHAAFVRALATRRTYRMLARSTLLPIPLQSNGTSP